MSSLLKKQEQVCKLKPILEAEVEAINPPAAPYEISSYVGLYICETIL